MARYKGGWLAVSRACNENGLYPVAEHGGGCRGGLGAYLEFFELREHLRYAGLLVLCDVVQPEHGELRIDHRERLCAGNRARRRVEHVHAPG